MSLLSVENITVRYGQLTALRRASIKVDEGETLFVSEEVGALNGTFLNGKRLVPGKPEPIRPGDRLALGMVELRMEGKGGGE